VNLEEAKVVDETGLIRYIGETHGYENPDDFFGMLTISAVNESLADSDIITAGELWVTYDIALYKPVIEIPQTSPVVDQETVFVPGTPVPAAPTAFRR